MGRRLELGPPCDGELSGWVWFAVTSDPPLPECPVSTPDAVRDLSLRIQHASQLRHKPVPAPTPHPPPSQIPTRTSKGAGPRPQHHHYHQHHSNPATAGISHISSTSKDGSLASAKRNSHKESRYSATPAARVTAPNVWPTPVSEPPPAAPSGPPVVSSPGLPSPHPATVTATPKFKAPPRRGPGHDKPPMPLVRNMPRAHEMLASQVSAVQVWWEREAEVCPSFVSPSRLLPQFLL